MASHVALTTLMSVFPFLIFVAALAGAIGDIKLADILTDFLFSSWPRTIADPIVSEVHRAVANATGGLITGSALIAFCLASAGVGAVRSALNRAYRAAEQRAFLILQLQNLLFVILGALVGLAVAFLLVLGPWLLSEVMRWVPRLTAMQGWFSFLRFVITGSLVVITLVAAHVLLPCTRPGKRRLWPGIGLTLACWVGGALTLAFYLDRFANYPATYAGLASSVTAIFFLYLAAVAMIIGAEFNASLERLRSGALS